jgi:hypothetical protein
VASGAPARNTKERPAEGYGPPPASRSHEALPAVLSRVVSQSIRPPKRRPLAAPPHARARLPASSRAARRRGGPAPRLTWSAFCAIATEVLRRIFATYIRMQLIYRVRLVCDNGPHQVAYRDDSNEFPPAENW